ncbi:MAG: PAS-domain containing protein [Sulfitobacter sp.]
MTTPHAQIQTLTTAGLNLIAQALSIYDSDLRLAVCNAPFQNMFDLPDSLVTPGATFHDTIHHLAMCGEYGPVDDIALFVSERCEQARAFEPHYMERTRSNGRTISVEGSPLPQGGWVTVYTDITRAKQQEGLLRGKSEELSGQLISHAEELSATNRELGAMNTALAETKRQLTQIEARTRLTTEMMPAHIAHVDAAGYYTYSNRRLNSIIPGRPSDILGLHISDALGAPAFARIKPYLQDAYTGQASVFEFGDVTSARRIRVAFTPDSHGGVYILSMDVTEETQARVALQQTRKRDIAAQMTSGLAHDFSNLLTIILGLQSKLAGIDGMPAEAAALIDGTVAAARRGGTLLGSIANMTSQQTLRPSATDLHDLARDLQTLAAPTLPSGIQLIVNDNGPDHPVLLDAGQVQDGLLNLILNARDACGAQGVITLTQQLVADTWIEWIVQDTGAGFSTEALQKGFDPFFTTKGAEGSGLGLPMVYNMTKLAGGDLRLSNAQGGALVVMRLPYRPSVAAPEGIVLLVEDSDALRTLYRDMLIGFGHAVVEAASVDEAMALIADVSEITLILSDIQIAGEGTGIDIARRMSASQIPVVLMTSLPVDDPMCLEALAIAPVLQKPFSAAELAALLKPGTDAQRVAQ